MSGAGRRSIRSVLLVDDDESLLRAWTRAARERWTVWTATTAERGRELAVETRFDLAVVDLRIGDVLGTALIAEIKQLQPSATIVLCSAHNCTASTVAAIRAGAADVLSKPITPHEIVRRAETGEIETPSSETTFSLARAEWDYVARVVSESCDNVSEAARRLGISRSTLYRLLESARPER